MKRMILLLLILIIAGNAMGDTYRVFSNEDTEWAMMFAFWPYFLVWYPVWHIDYPPSSVDPVSWDKIYIDGAKAVNPNTFTPWIWVTYFRNWFYKYPTYDGLRISRATVWVQTATSTPWDYHYIDIFDSDNNWVYFGASLFNGDTLYRIDITEEIDALPEGWYQLTSGMKSQDQEYSTIYYMSYDYTQNDIYELSVNAGWNLINLPLRFWPAPTLSSLMPGIISAWVLDPITCYWIPVSITNPLTGELGDIVRYNSLMVYFTSPATFYLDGYQIFEQRYLDYRDNYCMHYPIGGVMCKIPYDWDINEPDDRLDGVAREAKVWNGIGYSPDIDRVLDPFEGHLATYDFSHTPRLYDDNTHLDLRCQPMMSKSPTDPIEFAERMELDIYIPSLEEAMGVPVMVTRTLPDERVPYMLPEVRTVPPSGYDENGTPLPPDITLDPFEKEAVPVTVEFPVAAYPNPFNSSTKIACFIPEDLHGEDAVFEIYDIKGQLVYNIKKTINDYNLSFYWNAKDIRGSDVPSGIYYYRIKVDYMTVDGTVSLTR